VTVPDTEDLATVVAVAVADAGRTLDDLTATEAIELAAILRATLAALPTPTPRDLHLAATLEAAAALVEQHAGTD